LILSQREREIEREREINTLILLYEYYQYFSLLEKLHKKHIHMYQVPRYKTRRKNKD